MGRTSNARNQLLDAMVDLMWERSYGSLTIDIICERAQVKKGSFYYFFKSKLELSIEAMDHIWKGLQPMFDANFSASRAPLERLSVQMHQAYHKTKEIVAEHGCVLGCPYFTIGSEISTVEPELVEKVNVLLARFQRYFEAAIAEAAANGDIEPLDIKEAGRIVFNLYEGMITQARIKNDPEVLRDLPIATARILGLKSLPSFQPETAAA